MFLTRLNLCQSHRLVLLLEELPVLVTVLLNVDLDVLSVVLLEPPDLVVYIFVQVLFLGLRAFWASEHQLCALSAFVLRAVLQLVTT